MKFLFGAMIVSLFIGLGGQGILDMYISPNNINETRVSIEKQYRCNGDDCMTVIPWEKSETMFGSNEVYNGLDKSEVLAELQAPRSTPNAIYANLADLIGMITSLSILIAFAWGIGFLVTGRKK